MKKIILLFGMVMLSLFSLSCSRSNSSDDILKTEQTWENESYIKQKLIGKWKYWGHKVYYWVNSGKTSIHYFIFNEDNTFRYIDDNKYYSGTYTIIPATKTTNAYLYLSYNEEVRIIELLNLDRKMFTIHGNTWQERYEKIE